MKGLGFFFLVVISIVGVVGFICIFSQGAMMKRSNMSLTKDEISTFLSLLALQLTYPKAYKSTATNSFEIVVSFSM
jgi:hypothetical protein